MPAQLPTHHFEPCFRASFIPPPRPPPLPCRVQCHPFHPSTAPAGHAAFLPPPPPTNISNRWHNQFNSWHPWGGFWGDVGFRIFPQKSNHRGGAQEGTPALKRGRVSYGGPQLSNTWKGPLQGLCSENDDDTIFATIIPSPKLCPAQLFKMVHSLL